jgi:predicted NAD-dependent protein-ADP-ribosyltransferase YbiA (DUF1768 family)
MTDEIAFTKVRLPYGWLGNMAPFSVGAFGAEWRTTEALFQAMRLPLDHPGREEIRNEKSPMGAKMKAKTFASDFVVVPQSFDDCANMKLCLALKLTHNPQLIEELRQTGRRMIIEDCTSRPHGSGLFWGAARQPDGSWKGVNYLGCLWMTIRDEIQGTTE